MKTTKTVYHFEREVTRRISVAAAAAAEAKAYIEKHVTFEDWLLHGTTEGATAIELRSSTSPAKAARQPFFTVS